MRHKVISSSLEGVKFSFQMYRIDAFGQLISPSNLENR